MPYSTLLEQRSPGIEPETPPVFKELLRIGLYRAVFIGAILRVANPINVMLVAAAANILDSSMLGLAERTVLVNLFNAGASSTIALPVIAHWIF